MTGGIADSMLPRFLRVRRVVKETHDTVTAELDDSQAAPGFAPGQFNMLYLFGAGEAAISISGSPGQPERLVHTIRGVGAVTAPLLRARRGDAVGMRGPYGTAWPVEEAERSGSDILLIAGGIGLAPLRPVIYEVLRRRARFRPPDRPLWRPDARRSALSRGAFAMAYAIPNAIVKLIVDRAVQGWGGRVGVLTDLFDAVEFDPAETIAMTCGPEVMMRFCAPGTGAPRRSTASYLPVDGAQHEVRDRGLRPLPVRTHLHLQRRPGFYRGPRGAVAGYQGTLNGVRSIWHVPSV